MKQLIDQSLLLKAAYWKEIIRQFKHKILIRIWSVIICLKYEYLFNSAIKNSGYDISMEEELHCATK